MRLSPDTALLRWTTLWLGLAILSVPLVALRLLLPLAGLLLVAALAADAGLAAREARVGLARRVPERGAR
ncbi:MAG: hypothetical protein JRF61_13165, partial [Deltaproteobacteria bacterium]|nr:hypothetical protein [Deltaproteobacteria bacterium]